MVKLIWVSLPEFENQEYKKALGTLGYKVYGNLEIFRNEGHVARWNDHMMGRQPLNWKDIFSGYDAIIQSPPTMYYRDILRAYPNAKVVMEVVDSGVWYKRVMRVKKFFWWLNWLRIFKKSGKYLGMMDKMFFLLLKDDFDPISAQIKYNEFVNEVKKHIPREQLLIISPENGWQPICEFLEKPIPDAKFPHQVDSADLNNEAGNVILSVLKRYSVGLILYFGTLIAIFIYLLFFY